MRFPSVPRLPHCHVPQTTLSPTQIRRTAVAHTCPKNFGPSCRRNITSVFVLAFFARVRDALKLRRFAGSTLTTFGRWSYLRRAWSAGEGQGCPAGGAGMGWWTEASGGPGASRTRGLPTP